MWWLRGMAMGLVVASVAMWGCGSDSYGGVGQGTLQLMRFGSSVEDQPDAVGATGAQIDVCQNLCEAQGGGGGQIMVEPFSSTQVAAFVINRGRSDIVVESIHISYPNSGLTDFNSTVAGGLSVPGTRCSNNPSQACAAAFECGGQPCIGQEAAIPFTLLSLDRKALIAGDACAFGFDPAVLTSFVVISGRDASGERFAISGGINMEVADYDNCQQN